MTTSPPAAAVTVHDVPGTLAAHLAAWTGRWPPRVPLDVVPNPAAARPRWDGRIAPMTGVRTETGHVVLGVDPRKADPVAAFAAREGDLGAVLAALPDLLGQRGTGGSGVFRWTTEPTALPDAGVWLPVDDPRVPAWLHPFGGEVLVTLEDDVYVAGVGIKRHDAHGQELAVVTEERARGRGLARRLVAQAARRVLDEGAVPTYLHAVDNEASARVARASGFADRGWSVLGFFPEGSTP